MFLAPLHGILHVVSLSLSLRLSLSLSLSLLSSLLLPSLFFGPNMQEMPLLGSQSSLSQGGGETNRPRDQELFDLNVVVWFEKCCLI